METSAKLIVNPFGMVGRLLKTENSLVYALIRIVFASSSPDMERRNSSDGSVDMDSKQQWDISQKPLACLISSACW